TASPYLLAGLLAGAGATHFLKPGLYDPIVPHVLPGPPRAWTYASGIAEVGVAAAVANPATRRRGALAALLLFLAVFPANIQMALDAKTVSARVFSYLRLPLQVPLCVWACAVARSAAGRQE
ncbi:MAG: hypothetical protein JWO12_3049, partial [Frankiales bacterium]|nr:hypothetical protein [Frankiales bacterium]